jgi:hypothetical protein
VDHRVVPAHQRRDRSCRKTFVEFSRSRGEPMTTLRRTWQFVAGDSLLTPLAVVISIAAVVLMHHFIPRAGDDSEG